MKIWLAMLIPLVMALGLLILARRKVTWWELLIPAGVSFVLILIFKLSVQTAQVTDTEYLTYRVTSASYFEEWDQKVSCSHRRPCYAKKDGRCPHGGHGYRHSYDVRKHSKRWEATDSSSRDFTISQQQFEQLATTFGNRQFVDLDRPYYKIDGNKWLTTWQGGFDEIVPVTVERSYTNKVQANRSLFKLQKVDPKKFNLFSYPTLKDPLNYPAILTDDNSDLSVANGKLMSWNALIGDKKQVRIWLLLFHDKPREAGIAQEYYWDGGNKNELVVVLGLDVQQKVQWNHVFSWSESTIKPAVADCLANLEGQKVDLPDLVTRIGQETNERFVRRQFSEFNYLMVEPPLWSVIVTYLVTLLVSAGISWWVVANDIE